MTAPNYGIVLVTAPSSEQGQAIACALVESQLAACVSLFPVQSIYSWQGEMQNESEWQLLIKTDLNLFSALEAKIQALHSYEVPEIIALPILQGSAAYLNWIGYCLKLE